MNCTFPDDITALDFRAMLASAGLALTGRRTPDGSHQVGRTARLDHLGRLTTASGLPLVSQFTEAANEPVSVG